MLKSTMNPLVMMLPFRLKNISIRSANRYKQNLKSMSWPRRRKNQAAPMSINGPISSACSKPLFIVVLFFTYCSPTTQAKSAKQLRTTIVQSSATAFAGIPSPRSPKVQDRCTTNAPSMTRYLNRSKSLQQAKLRNLRMKPIMFIPAMYSSAILRMNWMGCASEYPNKCMKDSKVLMVPESMPSSKSIKIKLFYNNEQEIDLLIRLSTKLPPTSSLLFIFMLFQCKRKPTTALFTLLFCQIQKPICYIGFVCDERPSLHHQRSRVNTKQSMSIRCTEPAHSSNSQTLIAGALKQFNCSRTMAINVGYLLVIIVVSMSQNFQRFSKVCEALKAENLLDCTTVREVCTLQQQYDDQWRVECYNAITAEGSSQNLEKYKKISEQLNKDQTLAGFSFSVKLGLGDKLPVFTNLTDVFSESKVNLTHKQGEVLLIDVWATWCGPCQKPMEHNQKMLEFNEAWEDKVRIVAVSVDDSVDVIKQRVQSKKWNKIEHLTLLGWDNNHDLIKFFKVEGIPFVCLVNKNGQIVYTGHPSNTNLEAKINELIQQEGGAGPEAGIVQTKQSQKEKQEVSIPDDVRNQIIANLKTIQQEGQGLGGSFSLTTTKVLKNGKESQINGKLVMQFVAEKEQADVFRKIIKLATKDIPESAYINNSYINDPQLQLQQYSAYFTSLGGKFNIPKPHLIEINQIQQLSSKDWNTNKSLKYPSVVLHKDISLDQLKQLRKKVQQYIDSIEVLDTTQFQHIVLQGVPLSLEGNPYPGFTNLKNCSTNQTTTLKIEQGKSELIAPYTGVQSSQNFIEKLVGTVKALGRKDVHISIVCWSEVPDELQKLTNQYSELVTLYSNGNECPQMLSLDVFAPLYLIVIGEKGTVKKAGSVQCEKLLSIIDSPQTVQEKPTTAEQIAFLQQTIAGKEMQVLREKLKQLDYIPSFQVIYTQNLTTKQLAKPTVLLRIRKNDEGLFKDVIDALRKVAIVTLDFINTTDIPSGKTCESCKGQLKYPYYYYHSSSVFRCPTCAEKINQNGQDLLNKYQVKDNGVLVFREGSAVDTKRFGKGIQPTTNQEALVPGFCCNGCRNGNEDGPRYICMGCRRQPNPHADYVDFCYKCAQALQGSGGQGAKQAVLNQSSLDGHKWDHPLYRINYCPKGYYDF